MLLLPIGILSKAQGTNIDDDRNIQSNEYPQSILHNTPPLTYHCKVGLEALLLSGLFDAPSAKIYVRWGWFSEVLM